MKQRIARFIDPRQPSGLDWGHYLLTLLVVLMIGVASGIGGTKAIEHVASKPLILQTPTKQERALLRRMNSADFMSSGCYQPAPSLFRLPQTWAVISSEYGYDATLLGSTPCGDYDYMQPPSAENVATLPGPTWVHYTFLWQQYIDGSGYEDTFAAPDSGHFAYLHLHYPRAFYSGQVLTGGQPVGYSGWPSSFLYSNNSCGDYDSCRADAHLCMVSDWAAANWFYALTTNPPAAPKPKPLLSAAQLRIWHQYLAEHHKHLVSPFQGKHLSWYAQLWKAHGPVHLGGYVSQHWYGRGRRGYMETRFQGYSLFTWNNNPHAHVKWVRARWLR